MGFVSPIRTGFLLLELIFLHHPAKTLVESFQVPIVIANTGGNQIIEPTLCQRCGSTRCRMGLYDKPLPPRPPPRPDRSNKGKNPNEDEEDEEDDDDFAASMISTPRLFSFDPETGEEVNSLLPPLGRSLSSGVGCYFEPTDRLVRNLVDKTGCAVEDACWALEACKGDFTEAWTSISTARRMNLNANRLPQPSAETSDQDEILSEDSSFEWDEDSYEIEMEEEYERLKSKRISQERKRNVQDMFKGGQADQAWLPKANPRPIDDEPWFTG